MCLPDKGLDRIDGDIAESQMRSVNNDVVDHPYQPGNLCYANSRVLTAHRADRSLVNRSGKLLAHCIIDFCMPRYMYSSNIETYSIQECAHWLLIAINAIRERLKRATTTFNSVMNTCPEHMIPTCETREMDLITANRKTVSRLTGEKLETCSRVIVSDMNLQPRGGGSTPRTCTVYHAIFMCR